MQNILKNVNVEIYLNGDCEQDNQLVNQLFNIHDNQGANLFLLENYLDCINIAAHRKDEWIIFFDQDTEITHTYLCSMQEAFRAQVQCVAWYPRLIARDSLVSPVKFFLGSGIRKNVLEPNIYNGVDFIGLNSGSAFRVDFIQFLQNVEDYFRLDCLDYVISHEVMKSNCDFSVIDSVLEHDVSVLNDGPLDLSREKGIISAEYHYYKIYRNKIDFFVYKLKILYRLVRSFFSKKSLYSRTTLLEYLFRF